LTGRVPFMGDTFMGILTQHMFEQVPPLKTMNPRCNVSEEVERVVFRAVAKDPDERYGTMEELAADLSGALTRTPNSISSLAPPPGTITHYGHGESAPAAQRSPRLLASAPATDFPSASKQRGPIVAVASALVVAALGATFFVLRPVQDEAPLQRIEPLAPVEASARRPPPPAAPAPTVAPPAAIPKVLIEVQTEPAGADITIDGKAGCSPTPCTVSAERDALLKLQAELAGHRPSTTELRADDEHKLVKLTLKKRGNTQRSEPAEGELLIPDAFARPRRR
jgi:serine/threonine-protein kinase